jgi:hypothetical protein
VPKSGARLEKSPVCRQDATFGTSRPAIDEPCPSCVGSGRVTRPVSTQTDRPHGSLPPNRVSLPHTGPQDRAHVGEDVKNAEGGRRAERSVTDSDPIRSLCTAAACGRARRRSRSARAPGASRLGRRRRQETVASAEAQAAGGLTKQAQTGMVSGFAARPPTIEVLGSPARRASPRRASDEGRPDPQLPAEVPTMNSLPLDLRRQVRSKSTHRCEVITCLPLAIGLGSLRSVRWRSGNG